MNGSVVESYILNGSDAYGDERNPDTNDTNPFRYCGEYYDVETGNIYLRARYYDPSIGGFITEDPAKDGTNWYGYCDGNPVNRWDPSGKITQDEMDMFENGEMAPMAYTYLMNLTYQWLLANTQEEKDVYHQWAEDFRNNDYLTTGGEFKNVDEGIIFMPSLPGNTLTKDEHFFRNELNIQLSYNDIQKLNNNPDVPDCVKWDLLSLDASALHQNTAVGGPNLKYVSKDGHFEVVFNANHQIIYDPLDMGTYNYVSPNDAMGHAAKDVVPYYSYKGNVKDSNENPRKQTFEYYTQKISDKIKKIF